MDANRVVVLVVEDDDDLREYFQCILRQAGLEVRAAADGLQALRLLEQTRPHLIVLDLYLPHVSGGDLIAELEASERLRGIPIVVVTGTQFTPDNTNVRFRLQKPVTADALIGSIEQCTAQL